MARIVQGAELAVHGLREVRDRGLLIVIVVGDALFIRLPNQTSSGWTSWAGSGSR
jgi:hypothetical protein